MGISLLLASSLVAVIVLIFPWLSGQIAVGAQDDVAGGTGRVCLICVLVGWGVILGLCLGVGFPAGRLGVPAGDDSVDRTHRLPRTSSILRADAYPSNGTLGGDAVALRSCDQGSYGSGSIALAECSRGEPGDRRLVNRSCPCWRAGATARFPSSCRIGTFRHGVDRRSSSVPSRESVPGLLPLPQLESSRAHVQRPLR